MENIFKNVGSGKVLGLWKVPVRFRKAGFKEVASGKVVREGFGEVKVPPRIKLRKGFRRMWVR